MRFNFSCTMTITNYSCLTSQLMPWCELDGLIECLTLNVRNLEIWEFLHVFLKLIEGFCFPWCDHMFYAINRMNKWMIICLKCWKIAIVWCMTSDNVLVRRCDERCVVVNKCEINTFFNVIIHVIVKCKVMALSCELWIVQSHNCKTL